MPVEHHDSVFSIAFQVPFGIDRVWEVKGRMAVLASSGPVAHKVPGAGARLAPLAAGAKITLLQLLGRGE